MFNAHFYIFHKRKNSTKRPSGDGTIFRITLKDPSSILNPLIMLECSNPRAYNYCYIPEFDRWYFVTDWTSDHGFWIASCSVDVLASWRTSIRSSRQYVLRSGSTYDGNIADPLYPGTDKIVSTTETFTGDEEIFKQSEFSYVIGVVNGTPDADRIGGVTYYILTEIELKSLMNALLGDASYLGDNGTFPTLFGITKEVMQALVNPMQYIVESYLLPYNIALASQEYLTVGWWTLPGFESTKVRCAQAINAKGRYLVRSFDHTLLTHPQHTRGAYMNGSPFTERTLYAQVFGDIPFDCNQLAVGNTDIHVAVWGDIYGDCELIITGKQNGNVICKRQANVASPFKISQMYQDRIGMAKNAIQQVTSGAGFALGMLKSDDMGISAGGGYAGACLDSLSASFPLMAAEGNRGSIYGINTDWQLVNKFTYCVDDDYSQRGRPLCQDKTLSDLSGYVQILDPDIEFACYDSEYDQIAQFMTSGFFLE